MTTHRESILARIRSNLTGTTGVSTRIYRSRVEPLARGELPAIVVEPISDTCQQLTSAPTLDWTLTVRVAVIVRGNIPDQVADPIIEADQPSGVITCDYVVKYRTRVANLAQSP